MVAAEIRATMARRRMVQSDLAKLLGEHPSWVSRRLGQARRITVDDLDRIATALGVGVVDLLPIRDRRPGRSIECSPQQTDRSTESHPNGRTRQGDAQVDVPTCARRPRRIARRGQPVSDLTLLAA